MEFAVIGISYEDISLDILDKISLSYTKKIDCYLTLNDIVSQAVIVSTCNRSELYFIYDDNFEIIKDIFLSWFDSDISKYMFSFKSMDAMSYLFEVTCGFKSLVLGEDQIQGQISDALAFSNNNGYAKKQMFKIFNEAIRCSKQIKRELKISEHPLSLSYIGIKELNKVIRIKDKTALVIGSGKMASLAITYLYDYGINKVILCNRSIQNALILKDKYPNLKIIEYYQRYDYLDKINILVSATSSPHKIIELDKINNTNNVYALDLAMPLDIDEKINQLDNWMIIDMAYLKEISKQNLKIREDIVNKGNKIIRKYIVDLVEWIKRSKVDNTIYTMKQLTKQVEDDTVELLKNKLKLNSHDQYILEKTIHASMQRLIKRPINNLKTIDENKQEEYEKMIINLLKEENNGN